MQLLPWRGVKVDGVLFPVDFLLLDYLAFFFAGAEAINYVEAFVIV